jgi:hypothetical protein
MESQGPLFIIIIIFFFWQHWGLNSVFMLVSQELYCLSHASSPFYSGYFGDRGSLFVQAGLNLHPPVLSLLCSLG